VAKIKVGNLVDQREGSKKNGLVLEISYEESPIKNDPPHLYEYAMVKWADGAKQKIKTSFLHKKS